MACVRLGYTHIAAVGAIAFMILIFVHIQPYSIVLMTKSENQAVPNPIVKQNTAMVNQTAKLQILSEERCTLALGEEMNLQKVLALKEKWSQSPDPHCRSKTDLFDRIYEFHPRHSKLKLNSVMTKKMLGWLGGKTELLPAVYNQLVIYVMNKWTYSATIFNIIRGQRPKKAQSSGPGLTERQYVDKVVEDMRPGCDFCHYENETASDVFGRIVGKYSFTAANAFKLEEWHSLIIFKEHHPLKVPYLSIVDGFQVVMKWFDKVHSITPESVYPMVFWETMGHAGASQPHPHFHPFIARDGYYGYYRKWQKVAADYNIKNNGRNYFSDLIALHDSLGLAVIQGRAAAFTPLNPKKDFEFIIISENINEDFLKLLYYVFRAYIDDLGKYCFSIGISLPTMKPDVPGLPVILRIVSRGSASAVHSDVTSMELFATSLVETDPYKAIKALKASVQKRKSLL